MTGFPVKNPPKPGEGACCEACKWFNRLPEAGKPICQAADEAEITRFTPSGLPVTVDAKPGIQFHDHCNMIKYVHA